LFKSDINFIQAFYGLFQSINVLEYKASLSFFWFGLFSDIIQ